MNSVKYGIAGLHAALLEELSGSPIVNKIAKDSTLSLEALMTLAEQHSYEGVSLNSTPLARNFTKSLIVTRCLNEQAPTVGLIEAYKKYSIELVESCSNYSPAQDDTFFAIKAASTLIKAQYPEEVAEIYEIVKQLNDARPFAGYDIFLSGLTEKYSVLQSSGDQLSQLKTCALLNDAPLTVDKVSNNHAIAQIFLLNLKNRRLGNEVEIVGYLDKLTITDESLKRESKEKYITLGSLISLF